MSTDRLGFELVRPSSKAGAADFSHKQTDVVHMSEQIVDRAALGRKRSAQRVVRDRVEQVEVDSIMDRPGLDELFFHVNRQRAGVPVKEPAICRLFLDTMRSCEPPA